MMGRRGLTAPGDGGVRPGPGTRRRDVFACGRTGLLAAEARGALDAGAGALHLHPRAPDGRESLAASDIAAAIAAVRAACPGVALGVSTGAWIERDVARRFRPA